MVMQSEVNVIVGNLTASIQPSSSELEELTLDVKSKFEMFEHYRQQEKEEKESRAPVVVKKSNTVLAKMSRFQNGSDTQVGISDSDLNGGAPEEVSEDDENSPPASFPRVSHRFTTLIYHHFKEYQLPSVA